MADQKKINVELEFIDKSAKYNIIYFDNSQGEIEASDNNLFILENVYGDQGRFI